ncbi:metallopeptidase family protein [Streptomyces sp. NPDC051243]|uniref:metallopeptidase family protein n=1 Tax=Streptomyces sp. NPDC051243 TaxID=3365646 RepID=UPI0037B52332
MLEMTREEFEELVGEALDRIPPELTRLMDNVAVFVEDEPPVDDPELLGLYEGTPLTLRMCESREEVVEETEVTEVTVVQGTPSYTSSPKQLRSIG